MKVWKYVFITLGLITFLKLAGLPTGADALFNLVGISFDSSGNVVNVTTTASGFFNVLFQDRGTTLGILALLVAAVGGVIAGLFTRAKPENLILLPLITTTLVLFLMTTVSIMQYTISLGQAWVSAILVIFLLPFTIGFILALAEFFRGTD